MELNDTPDFQDLEKIQEKKEQLERSASAMGMYLEEWEPLVFQDPETGETRAMAFGVTFLIGDLALKDREKSEAQAKLDAELDDLDKQFQANAAIEAAEKIDRLLKEHGE